MSSGQTPGPFNTGGATVYAREDRTVAIILPDGREVTLSPSDAATLANRLKGAAHTAQFWDVVRFADPGKDPNAADR